MRAWTADETATLQRMLGAGATWRQVATELGRSMQSIKGKIETVYKQSAGSAGDVRRIHVPETALVERDRYLAAPPRDLTGFMLGDPPVGFSALERKKEPRAASVPVMGSNT
jgi:hypothetical protein